MNTSSFVRFCLVSALWLASLVGVPAAVLIDEFVSGEIATGNLNVPSYTSNQTDLDGILGGDRYISGTRTGTGRYSVTLAEGFLDLSQTTASQMSWVLEYGHNTDMNVDLTGAYLDLLGNRGFYILYDQVDQPGASLTISMYTTGVGVSTLTTALDEVTGAPLAVSYNFNDFSGNADISNIDRVRFTFNTTVSGTDISLKLLSAGYIPEPHTAMMLVVACGVIRAVRGRKWNVAQA